MLKYRHHYKIHNINMYIGNISIQNIHYDFLLEFFLFLLIIESYLLFFQENWYFFKKIIFIYIKKN